MPDLPSFLNESDLSRQPIERAETLPSAWYMHPEMIKIENESIFNVEWQLAGHLSEIPSNGDSLCKTIGNNPVILIREDSNIVKAYYNVCMHRGGPLGVKKGTTTVLQCGYHGWTYLMDGSLRGVPHWNHVDLFDKKDFGLKPVKCRTWQGLIFINTNEQAKPLSEILAGIRERISPTRLDEYQFYKKVSYSIGCNWKVYADNYLEGYHIPIVHPELANLLDYRNYVTELSEQHSLQYSPFQDDGSGNIYQSENGEAFYYFIYPNIMLNILPGRLQTNVIQPDGETRCVVEFNYYYRDLDKPGIEKIIGEDLDYSDKIQQEDIEICEAVQRGLHSSAYDKGRFSVEREAGVYHFQSLIKRSIRQFASG